ncbi:uncharacterized protein LOC123007410 [Tribolium madens]|uniref:uncharacterized protein LOC123007410 n=1 Tax=Tribolium madens TaxID=41895 RepID=UPI001CF741FE|nr:uncharacterized protein LOC123007410 [Tribolium madens]
MVSSNWGYPDPEKTSEDLSPNNEIIMATDTDTDEEENPYNDYQPLPTNDVPEVEGSNSSDNEEGAVANVDSLPPITPMEETLVKEVWTGPAPKAVDIEMDSNKVNEVKQAMINFALPPSSIPEWANNIPEEQWKQQLINRLQSLQKK